MKKLMIILMIVMILPMVIATPSFFFQNNVSVDLKIPTFDEDKKPATAAIDCNITIKNPNQTTMVNNANMTFNAGGEFNYTIDQSNLTVDGVYSVSQACGDGSEWGYTTFTFLVNPQGIEPTEQRTNTLTMGIYFFFILGIMLFVAFIFVKFTPPVRWTIFVFSIIFFVAGLNLLSITLVDEVVNPRIEEFFDNFTAISFYFYWFAAGLLILMWILAFFQTWIFRKNLNNMRRYGLA